MSGDLGTDRHLPGGDKTGVWQQLVGLVFSFRVSHVRLPSFTMQLCHYCCCLTIRKHPWDFLTEWFIFSSGRALSMFAAKVHTTVSFNFALFNESRCRRVSREAHARSKTDGLICLPAFLHPLRPLALNVPRVLMCCFSFAPSVPARLPVVVCQRTCSRRQERARRAKH